MFQKLVPLLDPEIKTRIVDYPTDKPLPLAEMATLVSRRLPAERGVLLAESFSGLVALTLLETFSSRFSGVIFVAAFAEPPRPFLLRLAPLFARSSALMLSAPSFLIRQYCLGSTATSADVKTLREVVASVSPAVIAQRLRLVGQRHSFARKKFDLPCAYIRATDDRLVPASSVEWFREHFSNCELKEIRGPHFLLQANPRESAETIARMAKLMLQAR